MLDLCKFIILCMFFLNVHLKFYLCMCQNLFKKKETSVTAKMSSIAETFWREKYGISKRSDWIR